MSASCTKWERGRRIVYVYWVQLNGSFYQDGIALIGPDRKKLNTGRRDVVTSFFWCKKRARSQSESVQCYIWTIHMPARMKCSSQRFDNKTNCAFKHSIIVNHWYVRVKRICWNWDMLLDTTSMYTKETYLERLGSMRVWRHAASKGGNKPK